MELITSPTPRLSISGRTLRIRDAVPILVLAFATTGCGEAGHSSEAVEEPSPGEGFADAAPAESAGEQQANVNDRGARQSLPEWFPEAFPLPDEYLIVRMTAGQYDPVGSSIVATIAIGGTPEAQRDYYHEALGAEFEDVRMEDDVLRFSGHGFELGTVRLRENRGETNMTNTIDSSDFPVVLDLMLQERREAGR